MYWILATLAEAWLGLGDDAQAQGFAAKAAALTPPPPQWMIDSSRDQIERLRKLLATRPLQTT